MDEYRLGAAFPPFPHSMQEKEGRGGQRHGGGCPCAVGNGLPFYMTYPLPMFWEEEDASLRDLEYLISLYPKQAKRFQKKINRILDTLDYRGSLIYDEYPDRLAFQRLSGQVADRLMKEEKTEHAKETEGQHTQPSSEERTADGEGDAGQWRELIQILLVHEIYRRRRGRRVPGRDCPFGC